jgi:predicted nucleic acid-binding protein
MKQIFTKRFPDKLPALESFISNSLLSIEIVNTPEIPVEEERLMRDMMDRPIVRSAVVSDVDIILTGDKDFLESGIDRPRMMTPSDFLFVHPSFEK